VHTRLQTLPMTPVVPHVLHWSLTNTLLVITVTPAHVLTEAVSVLENVQLLHLVPLPSNTVIYVQILSVSYVMTIHQLVKQDSVTFLDIQAKAEECVHVILELSERLLMNYVNLVIQTAMSVPQEV
jgi:hypothetical protein